MKRVTRKVQTVLMTTLFFSLTAGLTACGATTDVDTEEVKTETEHPTSESEEHPAAESEEHPAAESEEHPAATKEEHPAAKKEEHPSK
jgi:hypothetical protein